MNGPDQIAVDAVYTATNLNGLVTINTQGIQEWTVPSKGTYQIQAIGASGGNSLHAKTIIGGGGSDLTGEFTLTAGSVVQIIVGQMGESTAGGGGGGSYNLGTNTVELAGTNIGDGSVIITVLCSPTMITLDLATLTDVNDECSSDPVPPTATNDCGATINGVPDVTMPIITPGTTVVTWTFDDGQGNTITQIQNVILTDVTAPVADSVSLPDLTDMCGVTSVTAPTATDNCMGTITGTTTTTFPVSAPGASVITWTFDDGYGNTSTQTQNVLNGAVDIGIQLTGYQLNATALVATYQWLDCEANYAIISGEVNQLYDATSTGIFAAEITQGGCIDTSECILVDFTAIQEMDLQNVTVYPNPTQGNFTVSTPGVIESIEIVDVLGRTISLPINLAEGTVNGAELKNANYFVIVTTEKGTFTREVIVLN